ncbi:MAG: hypothetical protein PHI23_03125 [Candidatus Peribacteraceae bacterium]|nr:hypothetical protein [Candidatus Peribacteraceae bacterium]
MRKPTIVLIGLLFLTLFTSSAIAAQKNCADLQDQTSKGKAAFMKCMQQEQERMIKQNLDSYKNQIDQNKQSIKNFYGNQKNAEDFAAENIDLTLSYREEFSQSQIKIFKLQKAPEDQIQAEENRLADTKKLRSINKKLHGLRIRRLQQKQDAELLELDIALAEYELSLRNPQNLSY